jgi:hypothetical protein
MLRETPPHLFSILYYSIKAKQKEVKPKGGSAGINTGEPKFYSYQNMGALTMMEINGVKQKNGNKPNQAPNG